MDTYDSMIHDTYNSSIPTDIFSVPGGGIHHKTEEEMLLEYGEEVLKAFRERQQKCKKRVQDEKAKRGIFVGKVWQDSLTIIHVEPAFGYYYVQGSEVRFDFWKNAKLTKLERRAFIRETIQGK